jgi:hypothetical protein
MPPARRPQSRTLSRPRGQRRGPGPSRRCRQVEGWRRAPSNPRARSRGECVISRCAATTDLGRWTARAPPTGPCVGEAGVLTGLEPTSTGQQAGPAWVWDRFIDHNPTLGLPAHAAVPARERARIRGEMAAEWFLREEGGAPGSGLELQSALVPWSRSAPAAVGGTT